MKFNEVKSGWVALYDFLGSLEGRSPEDLREQNDEG